MPVTRIKFHLHMLHPQPHERIIHCFHSPAIVAHRIFLPRHEKYRQLSGHFTQLLLIMQVPDQLHQRLKSIGRKDKAAQRILQITLHTLYIGAKPVTGSLRRLYPLIRAAKSKFVNQFAHMLRPAEKCLNPCQYPHNSKSRL